MASAGGSRGWGSIPAKERIRTADSRLYQSEAPMPLVEIKMLPSGLESITNAIQYSFTSFLLHVHALQDLSTLPDFLQVLRKLAKLCY